MLSIMYIALYYIIRKKWKIVVSIHYQYISQGVRTMAEITQKLNSDQVCNLAKIEQN